MRATNNKSLLLIAHLKIGPQQMEITESGTGWVIVDGRKMTVDLMDRISKNPIFAALLTAFTAWPIAWFWHIVAPPNKPHKAEPANNVTAPPRHAA